MTFLKAKWYKQVFSKKAGAPGASKAPDEENMLPRAIIWLTLGGLLLLWNNVFIPRRFVLFNIPWFDPGLILIFIGGLYLSFYFVTRFKGEKAASLKKEKAVPENKDDSKYHGFKP